MATGLALPVGAQQGRASLASGEDQLQKILLTALADCDNENPYQQGLGIDTSVVFDINDYETQAYIRRHISEVFSRFEAEGRARLQSGSPNFAIDSETQELVATINYVNLKTNLPGDIELRGSSVDALLNSFAGSA
jgi:hypothetical protein